MVDEARMPVRRRFCRALRRDDGFTLIESVVALGIAAVIFMALAFALIGATHQVMLAQQNQQAGDVLNQAVEKARALGYDDLVMQDSDLNVGEASRSPLLSAGNYNPTNDTTSGAVEQLAHAAVGGLVPHVTTVAQNHGTYTVREYVTLPNDSTGASYKRLTVVVTWKSLGKVHNRTFSTLIAATKRGLPLPNYKFSNAGSLSACRNPSTQVAYEFSVVNNGARDQWYISSNPVSPPTWAYYADTDGNDAFDSTVDQQLASDNGVPTTGLLDTNETRTFFAVATVPSTTGTTSVQFTATSAAISSYSQTLTTTTTVQTSPCLGNPTPSPTPSGTSSPSPTPTPTATPAPPAQPAACTPGFATAATSGATQQTYFMYNPDQPGNTTSSQSMPVLKGATPSDGPLYGYSTDQSASAGRYLTSSSSASWAYQMPTSSTFDKKGVGELTMYAAPANGLSTAAPQFRVTLTVNGSAVATSDFTPSSWGCSGFKSFSVPLNLPNGNTSVAANAVLGVTVQLLNNVPMYLAYGTGTFASEFTVPFASGNG